MINVCAPEKNVDLAELLVEIRGVAQSRFVRRPLCQKICHKMIFTVNITLTVFLTENASFFESPKLGWGSKDKKILRIVKLAVPCEEYWAEHSLQFQSDVKAEGEIGSDSRFLGNICKTWLEWCSWRGRGSWWRRQKRNQLLEGGTLQDTSGPGVWLRFWIEIVILSNISTWPTWCHNWYQPCRSARDWWQERPK